MRVIFNIIVEYWAPYSYMPEGMYTCEGPGLPKTFEEKKSVICAIGLRGAILIYQNGDSKFVNFMEPYTEIPGVCFPQRQLNEYELDEYNLQMCLLIKEEIAETSEENTENYKLSFM